MKNVFVIIVIVAMIFVVYLVFLSRFMKKRHARQIEQFKPNGGVITEVNHENKRLLAFGAPLFYHRGEPLLSIFPEKINFDEYKSGLANQWDTTDVDSFKDMMENLISLERSKEFDAYLSDPDQQDELVKLQTKAAKLLDLPLEKAQHTCSTYAWDVCRAVAMAKWGYWLSYASEADMWEYMRRAVSNAERLGIDWEDFAVSLLLGREVHGFGMDEIGVEVSQIVSRKGPTLRKIADIDLWDKYSFK